jgi:putative transcriptional regulator
MAYHSSMKKRHFDKLVASVKQAGQIRRGRLKPSRVTTFKPADVTGVRLRLGKTQSQFALMIGVSLATLRNWEQGRRHPDGPARALLKVAAANPRAVELALSA